MSARAEIRPGRDPVSEARADGVQRSVRQISPLGRGHQGQPVGWQIADTVLAVGLLAGVVILGNLDQMPQGLEAFLAIRFSVKNLLLLTAFGSAWPAVLKACGIYSPKRLRTGEGEWPRLVIAAAIGGVLAMVFPLTSASGAVKPIHVLLFAAAVAPATAGLHGIARTFRRWTRANTPRNFVIVGSGPRACASYLELHRGGVRHNILGFVDDAAGSPQARGWMNALGELDGLESVLTRYAVHEVRIALPARSCYDAFQHAIATCERVGVDFSYPLDTFQHTLTRPRLSTVEGHSTVNATPIPQVEDLVFKRVFDIVVAAGMLAFLSPLIVLIAALVKLTSRGPTLFAQERYGKQKRLFTMYKFRTMHVDAECALHRDQRLYDEYVQNNFKLAEGRDPRLTSVGRLLRKSSLDELPQLWNVLRGDMSIVGPRPIVPDEIGHYGAVASLLLALKPGLTSMWVVEGRSEVGYPRRADLELMYVRNWSLRRDLWILLHTVPAVFRGAGAH
jgi:exopolysaccharide biosynthesis polyprenyl glycosylphosphotransferase